MIAWTLAPLARLRAAQARAASRAAAERWADVGRLRDAEQGAAEGAVVERERARAPLSVPGAAHPGDLAAGASARAGFDARSRRAAEEALRLAALGARAGELAARASAAARALEGRAEALRRGAERWQERRRAEREGRREREVEEAWAGR